MNANDIELALRARAAFNDSVERIDADTRRHLRELRLRAQHGEPRPAGARWMWPAGAALTAVLALVVFLPHLPRAPAATTPATAVAGAQLATIRTTNHSTMQVATVAEVAAADPIEAADPDMLSDLDFYGWLAKQPTTNARGD